MATFSTGSFPYSKVCGRITGRATGNPVGFVDLTNLVDLQFDPTTTLVDEIVLVDGITLSHSSPIQHIWLLAMINSHALCPCSTGVIPGLRNTPVEFAGDNYFCSR